MKTRIFISSVQNEFAAERQALHDYILADALLGRFFEPFLFERLPASDQRADAVYLREVGYCAIYLGILGKQYGFEDHEGISPTEREFDHATKHHKTRLIFLTNHNTQEREGKQQTFVAKVQSSLIRRRYTNIDELKAAVYASLVSYLIDKEIIRTGPFDATKHPSAKFTDLSENKIRDFVRAARAKRGFPLRETARLEDILTHLNLLVDGRLTNAAILLFGVAPQRFFINSEVRCTAYSGTIVEKPIPSYKVFKGDVFELVDQSLEFVLSKLDFSVGTRAKETSIPGEYEVPREIVVEAIVNAVAHRDYTSQGSVQVMVFKDRIEVHNPGSLPMGWTVEKLKTIHTSIPANPLLAEPMYLKGYIERLGTGTADMVRIAQEKGLAEPDFQQDEEFRTILYRTSTHQAPIKLPSSTQQVLEEHRSTSVEVGNLIKVLKGKMSRQEIQDALELKDRRNFRENYLEPAMEKGLIEMNHPDNPNHPKQKYLLTRKGEQLQMLLK
jgi:ATP-dependent DNA helicase RecG